MKHGTMKRLISLLLVLCMVVGLMSGLGVMADETQDLSYEKIDMDGVKLYEQDEAKGTEVQEEAPYADTDMVRAFVVMEGKSVLERGFSTQGIASNTAAMAVAQTLKAKQASVAAQISAKVLDGAKLNIHWNLTLAANAMSVDLPYGKLAETAALSGVKDVFLVPQYELDPREQADLNTISSGTMVGSYNTWLEGYTGAGGRIAVIDTGIDSDHPSFNGDAFDYSLKVTATKNDKKVSDYNLLTASEISDLLPKLHASERMEGLTGRDLFVNDKIAYGFNYVDSNLDITHDNDTQGDHGSHVSGIATANRYVKQADGTYTYADNGVVGIAPDAQLLTMKVFGKNGGAYADDYIAAIEDAIVLGCDSVNLSLGSSTVGFTTSGDAYFDGVMEALTESDTVVTISAGNSGNWSEMVPNGYLYAEDANTGRVGSPGAYENALTVASVDNIAMTAVYFSVGEGKYTYADGSGLNFVGGDTCKSNPFITLDTSADKSGTEYDYVFIGDPTNPEDTAKYGGSQDDFSGTAGKIVFVSRGNGVNFTDKQDFAYAAKAAAIVVYNNVDGYDTIYAACTKTTPFITIRKDQMESILAASAKDDNGVWGGKLTVYGSDVYTDMSATSGELTVSDFSSWGAPEDLSLKPEIAAPGGNIYSTVTDGKYDLMSGTSMAAPSVAGQAAVVAQYIKENGLAEKEGLTVRALTQSLLMGTATPVMDPDTEGVEYSPRRQGAGLANVENAVNTPTYITVDGNNDGKVKAEFGDDPQREGTYSFSFQIHNMSDEAVTYKMSGSMLAPEVFEDDNGDKLIYTSDVNIDGDFAFVTGNSGIDPNGDGKLDLGDVMAILNYAVGQAQLENAASADFNGDGVTDEVDAQILNDILNGGSYKGITLETLKGVNTVTVPANGTASVSVTMSLSEEGRAYMEGNFANGNYVEGYVYLNAVADAEGKVAVSQSIPFLAFYGNWTDPSMFDTTAYAEDLFNSNVHKYMEQNLVNYYNLKKAGGSSTILGVNAYARDKEFIADRTAVNSADSLLTMTYSLIRNAEDVTYTIANAETGEVYFSKDYGFQYGAFYFSNAGVWSETAKTRGLYWDFEDNNGDPLPDGTKLNLTLTAVPEYYTANADGSYDGLGKGVSWNTLVTIDDEAPQVSQMFYASSADGSKTINVVAQDNQYIAAIQIIKADGSGLIGSLCPNQQTAGEKLALSFDAEELLSEGQVIVAVVDYAGNGSAYMLDLGNGGGDEPEPEPEVNLNGFFAYNGANSTWSRFEPETANAPEVAAESDLLYSAAEYVDGYTVACTTDGYLVVMEHGKFKPTVVCRLDGVLLDMAYNMADGNLYALAHMYDENEDVGSNASVVSLVKVNYFNGELTRLGNITREMMSGSPLNSAPQVLACDDDGTFYIINGTTNRYSVYLYKFQLTEENKIGQITRVGAVRQSLNYVQSMAIDHNTGKLYWTRFYKSGLMMYSELYELDKASGKATKISDLPGETTGLYVVRGQGGGAEMTDQVEQIRISDAEITMYTNYYMDLEAFVMPWNLTDRSMTWSSSNPEVASVTDSGRVMALKEGTATITVTSNLDKNFTATCQVTVLQNNTTLSGVVHDYEGDTSFAEIDVDTAGYTKVSEATSDEIFSVVQTGDQLLACGRDGLYSVDADNGYAMEKLAGMMDQVVFTDMTYSPHLDLTLATYGAFILVVDPAADYGIESIFDLQPRFSAVSGIAYAGHDKTYDYFYLLSENGNLYLIGIQQTEEGYNMGVLDMITTDSSLAITGVYMYQSLYYDLDTGWIYWARFDNQNESSSLVAINEDTQEVVRRGIFDDAAWPVVGLYNAKAAQADADRTGDFNFSEICSFAADEALGTLMEAVPAESISSLTD